MYTDAAQSTALMCTNVVSYVLLTEQRQGCSISGLQESVRARGAALRAAGRDLGYSGETRHVVARAVRDLYTYIYIYT